MAQRLLGAAHHDNQLSYGAARSIGPLHGRLRKRRGRLGLRPRATGAAEHRLVSGRSTPTGSQRERQTTIDPERWIAGSRSKLGRLDLDTGDLKIFDAELPQVEHDVGTGVIKGAVSTAGVLADGKLRIVVAQTGLLVIGEDGKVTEKAITLPDDAGDASPTSAALDRGGDRKRLWAATSAGLVRMNADTFAVEKVFGEAELGSTDVGSITIDPGTGAVYAVVYEETGTKLARVDGDAVTTLTPGDEGTPAGVIGDVVWSTKAGSAVFAIGSWSPTSGGVATWNGTTATTLATEGQLGAASRGEVTAFGAAHLTVDDTDGLVIVGGSMRATLPVGALVGGGLAWIDLGTKAITGLSTTTSFTPGDDIGALTYDAKTRRTYIAARQPCNEHQLGVLGLIAVSFRADGTPRFERPVLSGVRSMAVVGDDVYLGLRDDLPGLSCFGFNVQTGLVKLLGNRAGEHVPLQAGDDILPFAGPTAMAVESKGRFAIGTYRNGTFIGKPEKGHAFNQAGALNVSLYETDVAWTSSDSLWIAGMAVHDPVDGPELADVGPRGAALVKVDQDGKVISSKHYVLASKDTKDITGLPSGEIAGVAVAADGSSYLACATERLGARTHDRDLGEPFSLDGKVRAGGVAKIGTDGAITVIASSEVAPDPRGIALDAAGDLWVLDAEKGLLHREKDAFVAAKSQDGVPAGAYPRGLYRGANGDGVSLYDRGALVSLGGASTFISNAGHTWRAAARGQGVLLIGSDEGLIRVRVKGTTDVQEKAPEAGALPSFPTKP